MLAQDEERLTKATNSVPSHAELNAMVARSEEERQTFDRMDAELPWPAPEGTGLYGPAARNHRPRQAP